MTDLNEDLFTPLSFGQTLGRTFVIFGRHWCTFSCLVLCILIPLLVIILTVGLLGGFNAAANGDDMDNYGVFVGALAVEFIIYFLFAVVAKASMMQVVMESYAGITPISGCQCLKKTFSRLPTLLCYGIVVGLIVFVSTILPAGFWVAYQNTVSTVWFILAIVVSVMCFCWMMYLSVSLVCAMPSIVLERDLSATSAMRRSHSLSIGYFCYIFGFTFVFMAASFVVVVILGPLGHIANLVLIPLLSM